MGFTGPITHYTIQRHSDSQNIGAASNSTNKVPDFKKHFVRMGCQSLKHSILNKLETTFGAAP
jgi:hypothetical protein